MNYMNYIADRRTKSPSTKKQRSVASRWAAWTGSRIRFAFSGQKKLLTWPVELELVGRSMARVPSTETYRQDDATEPCHLMGLALA